MKSEFWTILRIQCVIIYKEQTKKWAVFLKEINGFMLNVTDQYCISAAASKGGFSCHPGDLSRKCHLCHGSCKSRKQDKRPPSSRYKTYSPKYRIMVCPYFVSQQTELIQSETPPTSTTDLICKGTWSINEDVLFERCCFPHFFIIIILLIYLFSGIKNPFLLLIRVYILAQTVGIPNAIKDFLGDKKKAFAVKKEIKSK